MASLCICTVAACPASGIQVVWLHGRLPSPHPPSSPDSLGFCAHTQRAPLRAHRCGLGSAPVPLQAQPGLLGWYNQPNVKGPCQPLSSGARPCWPGPGMQRRPRPTPANTLRKDISRVLPPPGVGEHQAPGTSPCTPRQAGYSQVTPKFFPKMPPQRAGFVGGPAAPPLFTFFLGRGQRVGPAGESPEGGFGGMGPKYS